MIFNIVFIFEIKIQNFLYNIILLINNLFKN